MKSCDCVIRTVKVTRPLPDFIQHFAVLGMAKVMVARIETKLPFSVNFVMLTEFAKMLAKIVYKFPFSRHLWENIINLRSSRKNSQN
jgi:hypothetical protein